MPLHSHVESTKLAQRQQKPLATNGEVVSSHGSRKNPLHDDCDENVMLILQELFCVVGVADKSDSSFLMLLVSADQFA